MGDSAGRLRVYDFDENAFPPGLAGSDQVRYLRRYLKHLAIQTVIEEPTYFDRDYLAEFAAFYSTSARGYTNRCRRLHVFAVERRQLRAAFAQALQGHSEAANLMQSWYRGFVVLRPLKVTPIGRTVLALYPETRPNAPRITQPARKYSVHLAGMPLRVDGLAWQQQDSAVGACATVALWTAFHSSAIDDFHAVPTTVEVTRTAHRKWFSGKREFPAHDGLHVFQMCEAIRAQGLAPTVLEGDRTVTIPGGAFSGFDRKRFASSVAALLRSGYPVVIAGRAVEAEEFWAGGLRGDGHAICAVGFRSASPSAIAMADAVVDDADVQHVYIHDDNIGPNVRYEISTVTRPDASGTTRSIVVLTPDAPGPAEPPVPPPLRYVFLPSELVAALPDEIRVSPDLLHSRATPIGTIVSALLAALAKRAGTAIPGVATAARFIRLKDYLGSELGKRLRGGRLARVRLALCERAPPMSLHVGITRVAMQNVPVLDVLYDTTDSARAMEPFAHVVFARNVGEALDLIPLARGLAGVIPDSLGLRVQAF